MREETPARSRRDLGLFFRLPAHLVRELVLYYVSRSAETPDRDRLLEAIISAVCELPVSGATVFESGNANARCARITLSAEHSVRFMRVFPDARLVEDTTPGLAVFLLESSAASETPPVERIDRVESTLDVSSSKPQ